MTKEEIKEAFIEHCKGWHIEEVAGQYACIKCGNFATPRWQCGRCDQLKNGIVGEEIPKHFRLCSNQDNPFWS